MCGIAGYVNWSGEPVDRQVLEQMIGAIRHRGPDDLGVWANGAAGLAHARLSIVDLEGGHQPMCNEDGTLWITFNGEIFNYLELRQDLVRRGHRFATNSDTEVILHAFEDKQERCVEDFNGQWAFAIWDLRKRQLFLSRDRIGVRPLFYSVAGNTVVFGSEIKALFRHPAVTRALDVRGLDQTFTFWAPLAPQTAFRDVFQLPPGHSMFVSAGHLRSKRYWTPDYSECAATTQSDGAWCEQLAALLQDATRLRLRADVPVGAYLSGGLDSSIVAGLVARTTPATLKTFSITFDEPEFDESRYQQDVVRELGTSHSAISCSTRDISSIFPDVVAHVEQPVLRTAPAPMYRLASHVRAQGYKVVLTGEGADEVFGGYDVFKEAKIRRFWASRPESAMRPLLLKRLYPYLPEVQAQSNDYLKRFFAVRPDDCANPFFSHLPRWQMTSGIKRFFSTETTTRLADYDGYGCVRATLPAAFDTWGSFAQAQHLEASVLLPGYILSAQGDRVAMAHGVEARFPFLDHRVIELAGRMPARLKMRVLDEKHVLKRALGDLVPLTVRNRRKQPYRAPDASSFFTESGAVDYLDELLSAKRLREDGIFSATAVARLVDKGRAGSITTARDNMALVGILSTQILADRFLRHRR